MDIKLISIDIQADFGFFRKPDANNTIHLSYNIIHKPAILGILGAIIGLDGYETKGKFPEYYEVLEGLKIGVEPLNSDKGSYIKTNIKYSNTIGYANQKTNYLTEELTLVKPSYRLYLLLDLENTYNKKLYKYLQKADSEYVPYFGKNEHHAWWSKDSFRTYAFAEGFQNADSSIAIKTVFEKDIIMQENIDFELDFFADTDISDDGFLYFERLPKGFDKELLQYELGDFVYTTFKVKNAQHLQNLYYLTALDSYVQLL